MFGAVVSNSLMFMFFILLEKLDFSFLVWCDVVDTWCLIIELTWFSEAIWIKDRRENLGVRHGGI